MSTPLCQCFAPGTTVAWSNKAEIGVTDRYWDLSELHCSRCGALWLHAFLEYEAFPRSGRYYRAPASDTALEVIMPEAALRIIETAVFRIAGGSRFDGVEHIANGPRELLEAPWLAPSRLSTPRGRPERPSLCLCRPSPGDAE